MKLSFKECIEKYNIEPRGIIQAGCHFFQERGEFVECGFKSFVLIEPLKKAYEIAKRNANGLDVFCINNALGEKWERVAFYVDEINEGMSSSILEPKEHLNVFKKITFLERNEVFTHRLDDIPYYRKKYNVLFLDLQGAELLALRGAIKSLKYIDAIYTEVNLIEMYKGCAMLPELDNFLNQHGFERKELVTENGYGDAFYIKVMNNSKN